MKTKNKIKQLSRELFNKKGFKNVTLREVADELSISYGNVTYHFKTKELLIVSLYEDMLQETIEILKTFDSSNLFASILDAPTITFELSIKYLFFYVDFVEIRRDYPALASRLEQDNSSRKKGYLQILKQLQVQGLLREELNDNDLDYLMNLSGAMRTFFFINLTPNDFLAKGLKERYVSYVNHLIFPYLTANGVKRYEMHTNKQ
ncbi:MAG: TetR/AcrR family transcriptional regulator [Flavobacteriales bacterium]|jgi:AcrR family transcriptional regulator|nr:TetR/AcrR family transcriptional regulator [Flavobacteriales bacterium]